MYLCAYNSNLTLSEKTITDVGVCIFVLFLLSCIINKVDIDLMVQTKEFRLIVFKFKFWRNATQYSDPEKKLTNKVLI